MPPRPPDRPVSSGPKRPANAPGRPSHPSGAQDRNRSDQNQLTRDQPERNQPGRNSPARNQPQEAAQGRTASRHAGPPRQAGPPRHAGPAQQGGTSGAANWLYGTHPVVAALQNPHRRLRRLLLTEEAEAGLSSRLNGPLPLAAERTDRARLDALLGRDAVHGGLALLADPLPTPPLDQVLQRPGPVLVLDQVSDPRNVGAILRSAAAFGVAAVIVQDRNAPEETGVLAKAASGALETVPLLRAVNLSRTLAALKAAGFWTVGLDSSGGRFDGAAFRERRVALVLGAEGEGLRRLTRDTCDEIAGLVMPGAMESLNVSNAAAVALYELVRGA